MFVISKTPEEENPVVDPVIFGVVNVGLVSSTIAPVPVGVLVVLIVIVPEEVIGEFAIVKMLDTVLSPTEVTDPKINNYLPALGTVHAGIPDKLVVKTVPGTPEAIETRSFELFAYKSVDAVKLKIFKVPDPPTLEIVKFPN